MRVDRTARDTIAGKKKDMMSMFQSRTALEKQADKLSAKQEELNIKSTGREREREGKYLKKM